MEPVKKKVPIYRYLILSVFIFILSTESAKAALPDASSIDDVSNGFIAEEISSEDHVDFDFSRDSILSVEETEGVYLDEILDSHLIDMYGPAYDVAELSGMSLARSNSTRFKRAYLMAKDFWNKKKRKERYVIINLNSSKRGYKYYLSYVVDMKNKKLQDWFVSLRGYAGIGCGKGQTPPGFLKILNNGARGRKSHWGNGKRYWLMQDIQASGFSGCRNSMRREVLMHSNVNMSSQKSNGRSRSGGCFTVAPSTFTKWASKFKGNAIVFNTKNL